MAWNEPGGNPGKRNPWGSNKPEQGPPDLDEVIRNLQRRLSALFGGGTGGRNAGLRVRHPRFSLMGARKPKRGHPPTPLDHRFASQNP